VKEGQRVEILEASGLDEAHQYLMVFDAVVGTIAERDFAQDDVVAQLIAFYGECGRRKTMDMAGGADSAPHSL
jgi:hypothetical protein